VRTKQAIFGGFSAQSWSSIGGYRKCQKSMLFRLTDPIKFISKIKVKNRAVYFSIKYGLVFG
jgi:hypothetical protein